MKKKYITPASEVINLSPEKMLAMSVSDQKVDPATSFSNRKQGWNSEDWSTGEIEE